MARRRGTLSSPSPLKGELTVLLDQESLAPSRHHRGRAPSVARTTTLPATLAAALACACVPASKDVSKDVSKDAKSPADGPQPLTAACAAPRCGDGVVCSGEECDDGATLDGDGCSATCRYETVRNDWVTIPGARFAMGSESGYGNEKPIHVVTVPSFQMMTHEVTVSEFEACVSAGACSSPAKRNEPCNWRVAGRANHPMNCVSWTAAHAYCGWVDPGGRLLTEAEWEYAARSGGKVVAFPWGDEPATCNAAVMREDNRPGCGRNGTWPVCAKPAGKTTHGLCDMAGNVHEWVQDSVHNKYKGAPTDGSAWIGPHPTQRIQRGGSWVNNAYELQTTRRNAVSADSEFASLGFRCARATP